MKEGLQIIIGSFKNRQSLPR